ncbi:MAG: M23 family metallopeptidase [Acetobacter sp.]|nr:M23 family metallopeptidase [Acetobacter sp.]
MPQKGNRVNISLVSLNQRLDKLYDLTALQNALPIGKPISRIRVTSPFGAREDPFQGVPARHEAVDLGGMTGEPIHATAPGKVLRAGRWGWYGNMVEIDHGLGFRTRYAHMDKIFVSKGDAVRTGDQIGTVGSTGRSSGSHLHYEIRVRGYAVDPMSFMKAERNVFKD